MFLDEPEPDAIPRERSVEERRPRTAAEAAEQALFCHRVMLDNLRDFVEKQELLVNALIADHPSSELEDSFLIRDGGMRNCATDRSELLWNWDGLRRNSTISTSSKTRTVERSFNGTWVDTNGSFNGGHPVRINRNAFGSTEAEKNQFSVRARPGNLFELIMTDALQQEHCFQMSLGDDGNTLILRGDAGEEWRLHSQGKSNASNSALSSQGFAVKSPLFPSQADGCERSRTAIALNSRDKEGSIMETDQEKSFHNRSSTNSDVAMINKAAHLLGIHRHSVTMQDDAGSRRSLLHYRSWWKQLIEAAGTPVPNENAIFRFVRSKAFETLAVLVITLNAVFIAFHADYSRRHLSVDLEWANYADWVFCGFYIVELAMRIFVYRIYFFFGPDYTWNLFDFFLVCSAIQDQFGHLFNSNAGGENLSFLRVMRLLKMLKLLRMIRLMRMFRELRLIMNSVMGSIKSMFWSMIMIFVVLFMFGVLFLQGATEYLLQDEESISAKTRSEIDEFWGSLPHAILSLYMACMSGEDWRRIASPLWECGWVFYFAFLLYIGFYVCVIANTLTSLFVESTMVNADKDQQQIIQAELEQKDAYVRMLKGWYEKIDKDHSGDISLDEVLGSLEAPEMLAFASRMGIETLDVKQFFSVLSCNGRRPVDLETFVVGCIKLKGMAKSMDLMDLIYAHRQSSAEQQRFAAFTSEQFTNLSSTLDTVIIRLSETEARIDESLRIQARALKRLGEDRRVSKTSRASRASFMTDQSFGSFFVGDSRRPSIMGSTSMQTQRVLLIPEELDEPEWPELE